MNRSTGRELSRVGERQITSGWASGHATGHAADPAQGNTAGVVAEVRGRAGRRERTVMVWGLMLLCLLAFLVPALHEAVKASKVGQGVTASGLRDTLCRVLTVAGLPPTGHPLFGWTESDPATGGPDTEATADPEETIPESVPLFGDPATQPETIPPVDEPESSMGTEAATNELLDTEESRTPDQTAPSDPLTDVTYRDMSESERGPSYLWNETDLSVGEAAWTSEGAGTTILLVCSHPFETYVDSDGGTINDLAALLAADLRERGIKVIFSERTLSGLTADSSVLECYDRTQAWVRYDCRLYPEIGLVLDLRRSAETVGETRLAPGTVLEGDPVAQVRLIVDGLREGTSADRQSDVALAVAWRKWMFAYAPTLSRPVYVRSTQGLIPTDLGSGSAGTPAPYLLTLELGGSGNTYAEAEALIPYVGEALAAIWGASDP